MNEFLHSDEPLAVAIRNAANEGKIAKDTIPLSDWLDTTDVMNLLHISSRTLQTLRTNGTLPYSKLGGKVFFKKTDILTVLEDNYQMYRLKNKDGYGSIRK